jgi:hypothetical protein
MDPIRTPNDCHQEMKPNIIPRWWAGATSAIYSCANVDKHVFHAPESVRSHSEIGTTNHDSRKVQGPKILGRHHDDVSDDSPDCTCNKCVSTTKN